MKDDEKSLFDKLIQEHILMQELKSKIKYKEYGSGYININDIKLWIWETFVGTSINFEKNDTIEDLLNKDRQNER